MPPFTLSLSRMLHTVLTVSYVKIVFFRLPGGPGVKSPCINYRGYRFDPWSGKFHLAVGVASPKIVFLFQGPWSLFLKRLIYIYLFMAALSLHCSLWPFSSCREWGYFLVALCIATGSYVLPLTTSSLGFELDIETEISGVQKYLLKIRNKICLVVWSSVHLINL